jgi:hypothetical protein
MSSVGTERSARAIGELWPEFVNVIRGRLEVGAQIYGDTSFDLPAGKLAMEVEQELLDVCGWSFVMWCRLQALKQKLNRLEAVAGRDAGAFEPDIRS